jgi:hypothetical protein
MAQEARKDGKLSSDDEELFDDVVMGLYLIKAHSYMESFAFFKFDQTRNSERLKLDEEAVKSLPRFIIKADNSNSNVQFNEWERLHLSLNLQVWMSLSIIFGEQSITCFVAINFFFSFFASLFFF